MMLILAAILHTAPAATHARTLQVEDLRKTVSVGAPRISRDGSRIAVLVRRNDYVKDRGVSDLVLVDVKTHGARTLLHDVNVSSFAWSPNDASIAYVASLPPEEGASPKPAQLFLLPMNGGAPVQITHEKKAVSQFVWRPDGRAFAVSVERESPDAKRIAAHADGFTVTDDAWTTQSAPATTDLFEVPLQGGRARRIGTGNWSVASGFTYSGDGRSVYVTQRAAGVHPNDYLAVSLVRIDLRSGASHALPTLGRAQGDPIRSADGSTIEFTYANPTATMQQELGAYDVRSGRARTLSAKLDRNIGGGSALPDGSTIVAVNDGTGRSLFVLGRDGSVRRIAAPGLYPSTPSVAANGTLAFTAGTQTRPAELYVLRPGSAGPERLTNYNAWLGRYQIGASKRIVWNDGQGYRPDGVLTYPPGYRAGTRAPLAVMIHGGPTSSSTTAYSGFAQVMAANGWIVFQPNYRGSDNLGKAFAKATVPHITSAPGEDIAKGVDAVVARGEVDPKRIGVSGWSEGGLLTSWLITHDTRWRAAVSGAAVNDWIQYDSLTDSKDFTPQFIGYSPWTSAAHYKMFEAESPLTYASRVRTPTLILSDAGDYRVPTPLSYEFYHAVRATGTPVQFVVYPVIGHFPSDPVRVEDVYRRWIGWLSKYL